MQAKKRSIANTRRLGEKLDSVDNITERVIDINITGRRPLVSANQPQRCDVKIIAETITVILTKYINVFVLTY